MRSSNIAIRNLQRLQSGDWDPANAATYKGVAKKAILLVGITIFAAVLSAALLFTYPGIELVLLIVSIPTTLIAMLVMVFAPQTVKVTGTIYLIAEGIMVGAVSAVVGAEYGGVVLAALLSTFGVFGVMMTLYATGIVKVSQKFKSFMITALLAFIIVNLLTSLAGLIFPGVRALFYGAGGEATLLSIGVSVIMVLFASFFILVDLSNIDELVRGGFDKKYEWNAAFGLTVTLLWLYLEFLRLFSKIASRRR
ncbi:MAG: Bax inhibitor-1/YccA family protein [Clostridiales bacterium]|jgi:uncharacterized YccA/Bax inhibitor family protein|nr:Bax inhibitor-1/YccA family protein [Clostridiales bacterium]